jgi:hypothetical protein
VTDPGILGTVASITAGFGITVLFFRIDRELRIGQKGERIWIPWADWLLLAATLCSLVFVLLPMVLFPESKALGLRLPTAACAAALVSLAGYVVGVLAHYRLLFGRRRVDPRVNPEPSERVVVLATTAAALGALVLSLLSTA